jgi:hypothetical protein
MRDPIRYHIMHAPQDRWHVWRDTQPLLLNCDLHLAVDIANGLAEIEARAGAIVKVLWQGRRFA